MPKTVNIIYRLFKKYNYRLNKYFKLGNNMKINNLFTLVLILTILFALSAVAASEDVNNVTVSDDALAIDNQDSVETGAGEIRENQDILADDSSLSGGNSDATDLSVWIDVENVYNGKEFNRAGFNVPWNISAKVKGAAAHNVKLNVGLSDNLQYMSHEASVGQFDPATGIWDIGYLDSNDSPLLIVVTKLKSDGRFKVTVEGTSDSPDADMSNNNIVLPLQSGTGKSGSNITETTTNREEVQHTEHSASTEVTTNRNKVHHNGHQGSNSKKASAVSNSNSVSNANSVSKTISSDNLISNAAVPLGDSLRGAIGLSSNDDSPSKESSSNQHVGAVYDYDYTAIPLMIFALFLVALCAIVGYDKVKS